MHFPPNTPEQQRINKLSKFHPNTKGQCNLNIISHMGYKTPFQSISRWQDSNTQLSNSFIKKLALSMHSQPTESEGDLTSSSTKEGTFKLSTNSNSSLYYKCSYPCIPLQHPILHYKPPPPSPSTSNPIQQTNRLPQILTSQWTPTPYMSCTSH